MTSKYRILAAALSLAAAAAWAVETKKWVVSEAREYDEAELRNIAVSSTGRLSLAPAGKLLIDSGAAQFGLCSRLAWECLCGRRRRQVRVWLARPLLRSTGWIGVRARPTLRAT
jgi:hypothetical protein